MLQNEGAVFGTGLGSTTYLTVTIHTTEPWPSAGGAISVQLA